VPSPDSILRFDAFRERFFKRSALRRVLPGLDFASCFGFSRFPDCVSALGPEGAIPVQSLASSFGSTPFANAFSSARPYGAFHRVRILPGVSVFRVSPIAFPLSDPKARFPCFHSPSFLKAPRCLRRLSPPSLPRKEGGFHPASWVGLRVSSAVFRRPLSEESISLRGCVNAFRVASTPFGVFSPEGGGCISLPRNLNAFPLTPLSFDKRAFRR